MAWNCLERVIFRQCDEWRSFSVLADMYNFVYLQRFANTQQFHYHGELPFRSPVILAHLPFTQCNVIALSLLTHDIAR